MNLVAVAAASAVLSSNPTTPPRHFKPKVRHLHGCRGKRAYSAHAAAACRRSGRHYWRRHHHVPQAEALASWYADGGGTACGFHATYGVANKELACGTRIELCHEGCVAATVEDRGPFVAGRLFDLNPSVKSAIGCSDLCTVRYRIR